MYVKEISASYKKWKAYIQVYLIMYALLILFLILLFVFFGQQVSDQLNLHNVRNYQLVWLSLTAFFCNPSSTSFKATR